MKNEQKIKVKHTRKIWTKEENELLLAAVKNDATKINGITRWDLVAVMLKTHTKDQCEKHWWTLVQSRQTWTDEEDNLILKHLDLKNRHPWVEMSKKLLELTGIFRSRDQIRNHWKSHLDPTLQKLPDKTNDDQNTSGNERNEENN